MHVEESTRQTSLIRSPLVFAGVVGVAVLGGVGSGDWLAVPGLLLLYVAWRWLPGREGPPVLAMAFTFQWLQVFAGIYYCGLTGRRLPALDHSDYRTMVLLGLGCLLALLVGLAAGKKVIAPRPHAPDVYPLAAFSRQQIALGYVLVTLFSGSLQQFAWSIPQLTQGLLVLSFSRFLILFLLLRQLVRPRPQWGWLVAILAGEMILGFTGYFAGFRESLMMAGLAFLETFDWRRGRDWAAMTGIVVLSVVAALLWTSVKTTIRRDFENEAFAASRTARLNRVADLSSEWIQRDAEQVELDMDRLVDRMWAIYYPALAVDRVPRVLPHTDGAILRGAVLHILMPRLLFPNKADLSSDSEMVRKYSGIWVAGTESNTSIAFGYAAESYIDFGMPWMFLPVAVYGFVMGVAYSGLLRLIRHRDLAIGLVCVVFWLSVYLFERSWVKTLGLAGTLLIILGGATFLLDRLLLRRGRFVRRPRAAVPRSRREVVPPTRSPKG